MASETDLDAVVIGGGAAGLGAALVLGRSLRSAVVLDSGRPRNAPATHVHGFLTRDGTAPGELLRLGREEVERYGVQVRPGEVVDAAATADGFRVALADGSTMASRTLVLATGLRDELPDVPGLAERWGRDVLHCPYCHGYEVRSRQLAVLAASPMAVHQALLVRQWSKRLVLLSGGWEVAADDRARLRAAGIRLVEAPVAGLEVRDDALVGLRLVDGGLVDADAVFVARRFVAHDGLALRLGASTDSNVMATWVVTDEMGRTSVPGLYAAGNVTDPMAQVVTSAAAGARVAATLNGDLVAADVDRAAGIARPDASSTT